MRLAFPKPEPRKKERRRIVRERGERRSSFRVAVMIADGGCMDKTCPCNNGGHCYRLEAHHIHYRSQNGPDTVDNGITLCQIAHNKVHNGVTLNGHRISGHDYMLSVLRQHKDSPDYRWAEAEKWLERRRKDV